MQRLRLQFIWMMILAFIAWPRLCLAQDCVPERLKRLANPHNFRCSEDPRLIHQFPNGTSELYQNSNAILIFQQDYINAAWQISAQGAELAEKELVDALYNQGFNVFIWRNLAYGELDRVIRESLRILGNNEMSRLFFYYYGHGLAIPKRGFYFIPTDGPSQFSDNSESAYTSYEELEPSFNRVISRHSFYAFEGCNAGAIFEKLGEINMTPRREPDALRSNDALQYQKQFLTVTDAASQAPATGEFAVAISDAMFANEADSNNDGYIVGRELITQVRFTYEIRGKRRPSGGEILDGSNGEIIFGRLPSKLDAHTGLRSSPVVHDAAADQFRESLAPPSPPRRKVNPSKPPKTKLVTSTPPLRRDTSTDSRETRPAVPEPLQPLIAPRNSSETSDSHQQPSLMISSSILDFDSVGVRFQEWQLRSVEMDDEPFYRGWIKLGSVEYVAEELRAGRLEFDWPYAWGEMNFEIPEGAKYTASAQNVRGRYFQSNTNLNLRTKIGVGSPELNKVYENEGFRIVDWGMDRMDVWAEVVYREPSSTGFLFHTNAPVSDAVPSDPSSSSQTPSK